MLGAFRGDHAGAEQHFRAPHGALFDEVIVLHDQDFADVVRVIQEDDVIPSDFVVSDVAIFAGEMLEQQDGIGRAESAECEPEKIALEAGRESVGGGRARSLAHVVACRSRHPVSVLREQRPGAVHTLQAASAGTVI